MVVPSEDLGTEKTGYRFRLLSTGGSRQLDVDKIITRYESRIATSLLASFMLLGQNQHGSFALASSQTDIFATALGALLDNITETFNRFAVNRLMELNAYPREVWPRLTHGDIETPSLQEVADFVSKLTMAGVVIPNADLENRLLGMANLPTKEGEEDVG